jgi:hypothetical protein
LRKMAFLAPVAAALTAVALLPSMHASAAAGKASGRCQTVPRPALAALKGSLKGTAKGKLGKANAVRSRADFSGAPIRGLRKGVYFVSARVGGVGIATWAMTVDAFRTGGGLIYGVGSIARRFSDLGADVPTSTLKRFGLTEATEGYAASRSCVS